MPNEPRALTGGPRERRERGSLAQMLPSATVAVRTVALPRPVCPPAWTLTGMIRFSQLSPFAARRTTWHGIWAGGEWCSCQRHDGAGAGRKRARSTGDGRRARRRQRRGLLHRPLPPRMVAAGRIRVRWRPTARSAIRYADSASLQRDFVGKRNASAHANGSHTDSKRL